MGCESCGSIGPSKIDESGGASGSDESCGSGGMSLPTLAVSGYFPAILWVQKYFQMKV